MKNQLHWNNQESFKVDDIEVDDHIHDEHHGGFVPSDHNGHQQTPNPVGPQPRNSGRSNGESAHSSGVWEEMPKISKELTKPECRDDIKLVMSQISDKIKLEHSHMMAATKIIVKVMKEIHDDL